jgi:Organic solute transporter Ostalpha
MNSGSEEASGVEESETSDYSNLIFHLRSKEPAPRLPFPFSFFYSEELPKGEEFLRFCKFGTMQVRVDAVLLCYFFSLFFKNYLISTSVLMTTKSCTSIFLSCIINSAPLLLQYCTIRPLTTLLAILLDRLGLYNEATFSAHSGWLYITVIVNISIAFAFAALFTFYTTLKYELAPYEPVGKFLCIKFVIFVAFWQSVVIAVMVRVGAIHDIGTDAYLFP